MQKNAKKNLELKECKKNSLVLKFRVKNNWYVRLDTQLCSILINFCFVFKCLTNFDHIFENNNKCMKLYKKKPKNRPELLFF